MDVTLLVFLIVLNGLFAMSEMAVVSMGGIVSGQTVGVGGFDLDVAIHDHVRDTYGVAIGERASDEVKRAVGSAFPMGSGKAALVVGRELASGNTVEVRLDEVEVRQAMADPIRRIVEAARRTLAEAPPELTHDVLETGMFLMGGGALLTGLDLLLSQECEVPVHVAESPRETVVRGAGHMLEHLVAGPVPLGRPRGGAAADRAPGLIQASVHRTLVRSWPPRPPSFALSPGLTA